MTSLLLLGVGTVGGALLDLLPAQPTLRLVGVATRSRHALRPTGLDPARWTSAAHAGALPIAALDRLARCPTPILVDCTASADLVSLYGAALDRGVSVVAANKATLVAPQAAFDDLRARARRSGAMLRFETTVGAALPIIATLQAMRRTGDRITRIEGLLSGSLGFICAHLNRGGDLVDAIDAAAARGLLEPRPQADLSGLDVARKAVILARLMGLAAEVSTVRLTPLIPQDLLATDDPTAFRAALMAQAGALRARFERLRPPGHVVRYHAEIGPHGLVVGPKAIPFAHPAASVRGEQAWLAIHSARYAAHPLIVQGPGAGGAITASGVLADVLQIADRAGRAHGLAPHRDAA